MLRYGTLQGSNSPAKWLCNTVVTGSRYFCYHAPVLHWFCVAIGSIVVQVKRDSVDLVTEDYDITPQWQIWPRPLKPLPTLLGFGLDALRSLLTFRTFFTTSWPWCLFVTLASGLSPQNLKKKKKKQETWF